MTKSNLLSIETKIFVLKNYQSVEKHLFFAVSFFVSIFPLFYHDIFHILLFLSILPPFFAKIATLIARKIYLVCFKTLVL